MTDHDLHPTDIRESRVHIGDYHQIMCNPPEMRRAPMTLVDAKFSLPFLVAVAPVRRNVRVSDFTGNALRDPAVLTIAQRITSVVDPTFDWKFELPAGRVGIVKSDGRTLERTGTQVPGSPDAPLGWEDISRKFGDCAVLAQQFFALVGRHDRSRPVSG